MAILSYSTTANAASTAKNDPDLYDRDFFAWTQDQAARLRQGDLFRLDIENLVDEVEALGRSVKREIASRLNVLVVHLLKWRYQSQRRSSSWRGTIVEQRNRLALELRESPSLREYPASLLPDEYTSARLKAAGETGLSEGIFPISCPFAIDEILDPSFFPDGD